MKLWRSVLVGSLVSAFFVPRRVTIYVSSLQVPGVNLALNDTLADVTARPTDNRGYYSPRSVVTWNNPPNVRILVEPNTLGQRVRLVAMSANTVTNVIATATIANQTVRDTLVVTIGAAPAPPDTLPTYVRIGCILDVPARLDSVAQMVTPSGTSFLLYYYKVAGKTYTQKGDTATHVIQIQQPQPIQDSLPVCPPHL